MTLNNGGTGEIILNYLVSSSSNRSMFITTTHQLHYSAYNPVGANVNVVITF